MSKFNSKSPIPAVPGAARIDVRYGGTVDQVERESAAIAEAYMSTLDRSKSLLYINTLSPDVEMSSLLSELRKSLPSQHKRDRFRFESFEADEIHNRQKILEGLVEEFHLRVLIVNSFDFAALSPKGRRRVFNTLKYLRDFMRLHIILYTRTEPRRETVGVHGDLAWVAASVSSLDSPVLVASHRRAQVPVVQSIATQTGLETEQVMEDVDYLEVAMVEKNDFVREESPDDLHDWRAKAMKKYSVKSVDRALMNLLHDEPPTAVITEDHEPEDETEVGDTIEKPEAMTFLPGSHNSRMRNNDLSPLGGYTPTQLSA